MDDHKRCARLPLIGQDNDDLRAELPRWRPLRRWLAGSVLVTALGLGACAGSSQPQSRSPAVFAPEFQQGEEREAPTPPITPRAVEKTPLPTEMGPPVPSDTDPRPPPSDTPPPPMGPPNPLGE